MNRIKLLAAILTCLTALSCVKEKRETLYNKQESKIDQYISSNMYVNTIVDGEAKADTLRVVYRGGSNRLVIEEGLGEELSAGGTVSFYYAGYTFSGSKSSSNLFITNHEETATAAKWELTDLNLDLYTINLKDAGLIPGLKDGLTGVKAGEHCQILFSGKYGFGKKPLGTIPANSALLYEIWVVGVSNE